MGRQIKTEIFKPGDLVGVQNGYCITFHVFKNFTFNKDGSLRTVQLFPINYNKHSYSDIDKLRSCRANLGRSFGTRVVKVTEDNLTNDELLIVENVRKLMFNQ